MTRAKATDGYQALHELTPSQAKAVDTLAMGKTHEEAASAAGVHRVTVTRWLLHHPEFKAELNRRKSDAALKATTLISRVTSAALSTIEVAIGGGNLDAAFKWIRCVPVTTVTSQPEGPFFSMDVVEEVRQTMPEDLVEILRQAHERTTTDAENAILERLQAADD